MIRLGLRLAVAGGREALGRLALIAVAVSIGVGLLLATLAGLNAFEAQNQRYAWYLTGDPSASPTSAAEPSNDHVAGVAPLWWLLRADHFDGHRFGRFDVAATGPDSPIPPGIPSLPGPAEYYASPAMTELLASNPAAELGDRYPGVQVGTIGPEALPSPDSLVIIVGRNADELAALGAAQVTEISTTPPSDCSGCGLAIGTDGAGMTLVLSVAAAALLFPVLIFVGGATRLSAARREQRFAAMRLVGATPRQVSSIAIVESSVAAIAGVIAGFGLFLALRPAVARIPFTDDGFFASDVSLTPANILVVAIGIPVAAALAARVALRRVTISPLGVSRRATPYPPRAWRLLPLLAGVAWLGFLASVDVLSDQRSTVQAFAYLTGVFSIMIGLVVAGPWLTMVGARVLARHANRPAALIAARRLADDPHAAFRAISGVVLAVFVGSCTIGIITTIVAYNAGDAGGDDNRSTVVHDVLHAAEAERVMVVPEETAVALAAIPGTAGITTIRTEPDVGPDSGPPLFVASCAELALNPALGRCPEGAHIVSLDVHFGGAMVDRGSSMADSVWPESDLTPNDLAAMPILTIVVATDGSDATIERVRTVLGRDLPTRIPPLTIGEMRQENDRTIDNFRRLANVVLFASLPIAGCSLAVSVAGGLSERRRPFSLLRLTGVPLALLRRAVGLEAVVPLVLGVTASAGTGLVAAGLFLRAQLDETLQPPGAGYFAVIGAGIVSSLAVVATTLPLLGRFTGPEASRND